MCIKIIIYIMDYRLFLNSLIIYAVQNSSINFDEFLQV